MKGVIRLLVIAAVAFGVYRFMRSGCGTGGALACPEPALEEGVDVTLDAAEVCPRSGYLCNGRGASFRVLRWPLDKGRLRVRVPPVEFLDTRTDREVRDAVIEGIMAWDGHPFPIVIDDGRYTLHVPDIRVVWTQGLNVGAEGQMRVGGRPDGKRIVFDTDGLAVVVPPIAAFLGRVGAATARDMQATILAHVRAVAMHEMGHGLGLLHSDAKSDIMFPQMAPDPSGAQLSARDIATEEALYALPNGAMVR